MIIALILLLICVAFTAWPLIDLYRAGRRYKQMDDELDKIRDGR